MLGNVWRFDIDNAVPPSGKEATLIAELGQVNGAGIQPITTKPELTEVYDGGADHAVVNIATDRNLGLSDLGDQSQQSVYAFKDNLTNEGLGRVRRSGVLVHQTLTTTTSSSGQPTDTSSTNSVNWADVSGWYVDLNFNNESPGERVNVDMQQQLGLLTFAANVSNSNACNVGGYDLARTLAPRDPTQSRTNEPELTSAQVPSFNLASAMQGQVIFPIPASPEPHYFRSRELTVRPRILQPFQGEKFEYFPGFSDQKGMVINALGES